MRRARPLERIWPSLLVLSGCGVAGAHPRDVPMANVGPDTQLVAGDYLTCALEKGGAPMCWEVDSSIGRYDELHTRRPRPLPGVPTATLIALSSGYGCAVTPDGRLTCFESSLGGTPEMDHEAPHVYEEMGPPVALATAGRVAGKWGCFADAEHRVACFTDGVGSMPNRPPKGLEVVALSAGGAHMCGVGVDGQVVCWGDNDHRQLGKAGYRGGVVIGIADAVQVAAGGRHTCARTRGGNVLCWGADDVGQLGDGAPGEDRVSPGAVSGLPQKIVDVAAGSEHTCAVDATGGLWCWGHNFGGRLADGTDVDRAEATRSPMIEDAIRVSTGTYQTCVLRRSGKITCFGMSEVMSFSMDLETGEITR